MSRWFERPRIYYDWALYGQDLDRDYARQVVKKALDVHADTLAFCPVLGGYALWPSVATPQYDRALDLDLIGELCRLSQDEGLRFVPWWLATASGGTACWLEKHPDWTLVGPPQEDGSQHRQNYICYNTPYRDILYDEVREILSGYLVDGIYFDQLPGSCYCPHCRADFEREFGEPMPIVRDEFFVYNSPAGLPETLREFRDGRVRAFCAGIRSIVDEVRPEACYAQNWVRGVQAQLAADYADVLLPEFYQRTDLVPLGMRMRLTKAYFGGRPIWGNVRHGVRHDARHFPVRPTRMLLMDCIANHAAPLMLDLCAMDFDRTGMDELVATFDDMKVVQDALEGAEPVPCAALLHSRSSHLADCDRFEGAFEGLYRLLLEHHVPCEIVTEQDAVGGELNRYQVVVLADAYALGEETLSAVRKAADKGAGVLATYSTGFADTDGRLRETPGLADLLGVKVTGVRPLEGGTLGPRDPLHDVPGLDGSPFHYGSARGDHPLARDIPDESLFSFLGGYVECRAVNGAQVAAGIHLPDTERLAAPAVNRRGLFPMEESTWPLVVTRTEGRQRTVYIAGQVEAEMRWAHAPEIDALLMGAVQWLGGSLPVAAVDCPRSVEARLFQDHDRRRLILLLVNLTTNPLVPSSAGPAIVRYVTPLKGIRLRLAIPAPARTIRSLLGGSPTLEPCEDGVVVDLPELDLYDCLTIEYGD